MPETVLIVDANAEEARSAMVELTTAGYHVLMAEDAIQAMTVARGADVDLMIVDLAAPGGGGTLFIGRILGMPATARIPVIALANSARDGIDALSTGARAVVQRPFGPGDLVDAVAANIHLPGVLPQAPRAVLEDPARLESVQRLGGLDEPVSEDLDRFTRLASQLLGVPTALISIIDSHRQFFASQHGLAEPWATARETALSHSFCQFAVTFRQPLVISNAREHPLVSTNLAVTEMGIQAYAGIPLITADGQAIGSLCAIGPEVRDWSDQDIETLNDLAGILIDYLELRSAVTSALLVP